jgi:hypothetical protein
MPRSLDNPPSIVKDNVFILNNGPKREGHRFPHGNHSDIKKLYPFLRFTDKSSRATAVIVPEMPNKKIGEKLSRRSPMLNDPRSIFFLSEIDSKINLVKKPQRKKSKTLGPYEGEIRNDISGKYYVTFPPSITPPDFVKGDKNQINFVENIDSVTEKKITKSDMEESNQVSRPRDNNYAQPRDNNYAQPRDNNYSQPRDNNYAQPRDNNYAQPRDNNYAQPRDDNYAQPRDSNYAQPRDNNYAQPRDNNYSQPRDNNYSQPRDNNYSQPRDNNYAQPRDNNYSQPRDNNYAQPRDNNYDQPSFGSNSETYRGTMNQAESFFTRQYSEDSNVIKMFTLYRSNWYHVFKNLKMPTSTGIQFFDELNRGIRELLNVLALGEDFEKISAENNIEPEESKDLPKDWNSMLQDIIEVDTTRPQIVISNLNSSSGMVKMMIQFGICQNYVKEQLYNRSQLFKNHKKIILEELRDNQMTTKCSVTNENRLSTSCRKWEKDDKRTIFLSITVGELLLLLRDISCSRVAHLDMSNIVDLLSGDDVSCEPAPDKSWTGAFKNLGFNQRKAQSTLETITSNISNITKFLELSFNTSETSLFKNDEMKNPKKEICRQISFITEFLTSNLENFSNGKEGGANQVPLVSLKHRLQVVEPAVFVLVNDIVSNPDSAVLTMDSLRSITDPAYIQLPRESAGYNSVILFSVVIIYVFQISQLCGIMSRKNIKEFMEISSENMMNLYEIGEFRNKGGLNVGIKRQGEDNIYSRTFKSVFSN